MVFETPELNAFRLPNSRRRTRARALRSQLSELSRVPDMKPINAWPLIILLVAVLFLLAWFGGYL
jgi:hypothetical protein